MLRVAGQEIETGVPHVVIVLVKENILRLVGPLEPIPVSLELMALVPGSDTPVEIRCEVLISYAPTHEAAVRALEEQNLIGPEQFRAQLALAKERDELGAAGVDPDHRPSEVAS